MVISCKRKHKHKYRCTKKYVGGFRYNKSRSEDVLISSSYEPKSRTRSRSRSRISSKSKRKSRYKRSY